MLLQCMVFTLCIDGGWNYCIGCTCFPIFDSIFADRPFAQFVLVQHFIFVFYFIFCCFMRYVLIGLKEDYDCLFISRSNVRQFEIFAFRIGSICKY